MGSDEGRTRGQESLHRSSPERYGERPHSVQIFCLILFGIFDNWVAVKTENLSQKVFKMQILLKLQ